MVSNAKDVKVYVFGGNSRTNASIATNGGTNKTYASGQIAQVDVSAGAVVLVQPRNYSLTGGNFEFKFGITGDTYPFYEKYFLGGDGYTWFIVAISVAGVMAFFILIAILLCIIKCIRGCCCKRSSRCQ